jgi:glutaredoxin 3
MLDIFANAGFKGREVSQPKVEIYTKLYCGYCYRAKGLLERKGVDFIEYDITLGGPKRDEMRARKPDAYTVPQIFIDNVAVGGSDDLARLDREGKLDALLGL